MVKKLSIKLLIFLISIVFVPLAYIVDFLDSLLWTLVTKVETKVVWRKIK